MNAEPITSSSGARPHFQRLDVLRALAICLVFFDHYYTGLYALPAQAAEFVARWPKWLQPWQSAVLLLPKSGYLGVPLFFVISGFCIHGSYLSWRKKSPLAPLVTFTPLFFWKRFWRIYPPFAVALVVSYSLAYEHPLALSSLRKFALNATLLKTLFPGYFYTINYAHWSVAVEWQLYLVYPALLFLFLRYPYATLIATWATSISLEFFAGHWTSSTFILNLPFKWWFEWTLGVLIAERHSRHTRLFKAHGILGISLLAGLVFSLSVDWWPGIWFFSRIFFAVIVEQALVNVSAMKTWEKLLVPVGLCSYSIYLFHLPLMNLYWRLLHRWEMDLRSLGTWIVTGGVLLLGTIAFSWLTYRVLELGSVRIGERLWRRLAKPGSATEA